MIDVNGLRKGVTFTMDGELFKVIDYQHHKPGRGKAVIRTKLRNLRSGSTIDKNFTSGDRVRTSASITRRSSICIATANSTTLWIPRPTSSFRSDAVLEDAKPYLVENMEIELSSYEGEQLDVELPITVDLTGDGGAPGFAGDTARARPRR